MPQSHLENISLTLNWLWDIPWTSAMTIGCLGCSLILWMCQGLLRVNWGYKYNAAVTSTIIKTAREIGQTWNYFPASVTHSVHKTCGNIADVNRWLYTRMHTKSTYPMLLYLWDKSTEFCRNLDTGSSRLPNFRLINFFYGNVDYQHTPVEKLHRGADSMCVLVYMHPCDYRTWSNSRIDNSEECKHEGLNNKKHSI